jgi:hypothetical protein
MAKDKKERVLKNEEQRLRNVASARLAARGRSASSGAIKAELKKAIQVRLQKIGWSAGKGSSNARRRNLLFRMNDKPHFADWTRLNRICRCL